VPGGSVHRGELGRADRLVNAKYTECSFLTPGSHLRQVRMSRESGLSVVRGSVRNSQVVSRWAGPFNEVQRKRTGLQKARER